MPLVRITLASGTSAARRRAIADGVHQALVETAAVPADDRFQSVHEVAPSDLYWSAITRSRNVASARAMSSSVCPGTGSGRKPIK